MDRSKVSRLANRFREGFVKIDNDPRPGRLRTSTNERSVNLVGSDALEENSVATYEELISRTQVKIQMS